MKDVLAGPAESHLNTRSLDAAIKRVKAAGLRVTLPRVAILKFLVETGEPIAIEKLHGALDDETCDLVTCYRILEAFERAGIVRRTFTENGTRLYEIIGSEASKYYVTCRDTDRMARLSTKSADTLNHALYQIKADLAEQGYTDITHSMQFFAKGPMVQVAVGGSTT